MEDVQSKYTGNVVSVTTTAVDISSKAKLDVISQTNSTIMSMACKAPGAENIIAMAGAFKGCQEIRRILQIPKYPSIHQQNS